MKPHTYNTNPKLGIERTTGNNKQTVQSTGTTSTTVSNFMQWEAKLPPSSKNGNKKRVTVLDLMQRMKGNEQNDIVDLSTEDKVCVVLYPPTGAKFSSFKLNSTGTTLTVFFRIHQLMWDPDAVYYCIQDSTELSSESEARMDERHRSLKDSVRSHFHSKSKGGKLTREHSMTVNLKKQVDPDKKPIFIPYVFNYSEHNQDQLTLCYFELDIFQPRIKRTPEKVEISQIVYVDTTGDNNASNSTASTSASTNNSSTNIFMNISNTSSSTSNRESHRRSGDTYEDNSQQDDDDMEETSFTIQMTDKNKIEQLKDENNYLQQRLRAFGEKFIEEQDKNKELKDQLVYGMQQFDELRVYSEQKIAEVECKNRQLEESLIGVKTANFEAKEELEKAENEREALLKEKERMFLENEALHEKITTLESDMQAHIDLGNSLMNSLNDSNEASGITTLALVPTGNKKRRLETALAQGKVTVKP